MFKSRVRTLIASLVAASAFGAAVAQQDLVIAVGTDAVTLDVHAVTDTPTFNITGHIFETLFVLTPEGNVAPHLATGYEINEDGTVVSLTLRDDVTFHDGTPFNAEAVKANIERIKDPELANAFATLVGNVEGVTVTGEYSVDLHLPGPFAPLLPHLTHASQAIMAPSSMDDPEIQSNPVGTGPFVLDEWARGERLSLVRNDNYWREPSDLSSVTFLPISEGATRIAMIESGAAHVVVNVPPQDVDRIDAMDNVTVHKVDSMRTIYIFFNNYREPFTDVRVRQAINHAVDKQAIVDFVLGGAGRVSDAAIAPGVFGYTPVGTYEYDPELARELLAEAGFPDGLDITLHSPTGRYMQDIQVAEAVQSYLAEVGVRAEIVSLEWASYLAEIGRPAEESVSQLGLMGWGVSTGDADQGLFNVLHGSQVVPFGSNRSLWDFEAFNDLLDQGRVETDEDARRAVYAEALQVAYDEAPWLYLHTERQLVAVADNVSGLDILPTERIYAYEVTTTYAHPKPAPRAGGALQLMRHPLPFHSAYGSAAEFAVQLHIHQRQPVGDAQRH